MHEDPAPTLELPAELPEDIAYNALNYRTAATPHAEQAWQELAASVRSYALAAVEAERERCAKLCEVVAASQADWLNGPALDCAAAIRNQGKG